MTKHWNHVVLALLIAVGSSLPARSAAAQDGFRQDSNGLAVVGFVGLVGLLSVPVFGTAEIVYAAHGQWLPIGWAVNQLLFAGGSWTVIAEFTLSHGRSEFAAPYAALAAWFITDSVLSIALHKSADARASPRQLTAAVLPVANGAEGVVMGRF